MRISPTWYPNMPPVDTDDASFKHVLSWLVSHGAPEPEFKQGEFVTGTSARMPDRLVYTKDGKSFEGDAVLTFLSPAMSLTEVQRALGFGNPLASEPFTPLAAPVATPAVGSPVGGVIVGKPGRRILVASFAGHLPFGFEADGPDGKYRLVDSDSPFNRTGEWLKI